MKTEGDTFYVYRHIRLDKNIPFYVGKGRLYRAWEFKHRNRFWHAVVNKFGYKIEIIKYFDNEADAYEFEYNLINLYKSFDMAQANIMIGGLDGRPLKSSSREYLREINLGKKLSEEHKKKISISNKGKIVTPEQRKKMSDGHKGKVLTEEHRSNVQKSSKTVVRKYYGDKISKKLKGITNKYKGTPPPKMIYYTPNGIFYTSRSAAKNNNCSQKTIFERCKSENFTNYRKEIINND